MTDRTRRLVLLVVGVVLAWYAAVVIVAARPAQDAVPLGNIPAWEQLPVDASTSVPPEPIGQDVVVVERVECGSVFDGSARSGTLPSLPFPQRFNREPCTLAHDDARLVFGINTLVVVAVLAAAAVLVLRMRRRPPDTAGTGTPQPPLVGAGPR